MILSNLTFNWFLNAGKEIILRRYLNDQSPDLASSLNAPGFLSVAMNHLKENNKPAKPMWRKIPASIDG